MANAVEEAFGLAKAETADEVAEVIEFANGFTGRRQDDGWTALYRPDGKPTGTLLNDREVSDLIARQGRG
jgi:hypothetical protein